MIRGIAAVAGLTWREAWRGRLWLVPLAAMALIAVVAPQADATDTAGAVRLIAAASLAAAGFCAVLVAALVPAAQLTRDLETRIALTVLPKPLPRIGWLLGRWSGAVALAGIASLAISFAGSAAVAWRAGAVPVARDLDRPSGFQRVSGLGEAVAVAQDTTLLTGPAGDGARWRFTGLDPARADGYEVLVRVALRGGFGGPQDATPVRLVALASAGDAQPLSLDPESPYGRAPARAVAPGANCWLAHREANRDSLAGDWARLRLPAGAITAAGTLDVQVTRLDPTSSILVSRASCAIAVPAGRQPLHAARAILAGLAGPAVVAAAALAVAAVSSLPVALLASLTLAFAGHALWVVRESLADHEGSRAVSRLMELALTVFPDLGSTTQGVRLAAGEAITWAAVGGAWLTVAPHLLVLLLLGWWALARREM